MPPQGHSIGLALEDTVLLARLLSEKPELSLEEVFTRWDNIRRPMISESYKHASRGFNSNKELSWFWNLVREWVTWAIISTFGRYMDHQFTYDISKLEI